MTDTRDPGTGSPEEPGRVTADAGPDAGGRAGWSPPPSSPPPPQRITLPPGIRPPAVPGYGPGPAGPPGYGHRYPAPPGSASRPGPYPWPATANAPSGLFPSGPPRPTYREPHQATLGTVALGGAAAAAWMALFGLLAGTAREYVWWTIAAGTVAWLSALALARWGMRGIAAGIALTSGFGLAIGGMVVIAQWTGGHWLL